MAPLVDEAPSPDLADLVDAVGELESPVLDMDRGFAVRPIAAVDIGNPGHQSMPRALSLRCSAERSIPTNSAVREILPPKRLIWARRYSRSNISRASRSGRPIRCSPPLPFGRFGTIAQ